LERQVVFAQKTFKIFFFCGETVSRNKEGIGVGMNFGVSRYGNLGAFIIIA
jgi:hypothetical protein